MSESWRNLKPGDRVVVRRPLSEMEKALIDREFVVDRITKPHGFAVVGDEWGKWHVHPESLELRDA